MTGTRGKCLYFAKDLGGFHPSDWEAFNKETKETIWVCTKHLSALARRFWEIKTYPGLKEYLKERIV